MVAGAGKTGREWAKAVRASTLIDIRIKPELDLWFQYPETLIL